MAIAVEMPKLSDTMEEGVVSAWMAEEGDDVSAGDVIAQVETDKATMDLEVFDDGVLLKRVAEEGETIPLGELIAVLGEEGEDISDLLDEHGADGAAADAEDTQEEDEDEKADEAETEAAQEEEAADEEDETPEEDEEAQQAAQQEEAEEESATQEEDVETQRAASQAETQEDPAENGRIKASPLARRMAGENEIDLAGVEGSGPQGRIVKRDIEAILSGEKEAAPAASPSGDGAFERPAEVAPQSEEELYEAESISQMRKAIARRLAASKYTAPHFYLTVDVDAARLMAVREQVNALAEAQERARVSVNDFITKACAVALKSHPQVNAAYLADEGEIRRYHAVHVGVAVAVDEGLITPVIRDADQKGLAQIAEETKALAGQAHEGTLQPQDYEGATFTTSNLGPWGIEEFTAIINPPNACILAIGAIREVPVVEEGKVVPGQRMKLTLSCDHRIVDGATGADYLDTLQGLLEEPVGLLL